jgi:hypothetical protein
MRHARYASFLLSIQKHCSFAPNYRTILAFSDNKSSRFHDIVSRSPLFSYT